MSDQGTLCRVCFYAMGATDKCPKCGWVMYSSVEDALRRKNQDLNNDKRLLQIDLDKLIIQNGKLFDELREALGGDGKLPLATEVVALRSDLAEANEGIKLLADFIISTTGEFPVELMMPAIRAAREGK